MSNSGIHGPSLSPCVEHGARVCLNLLGLRSVTVVLRKTCPSPARTRLSWSHGLSIRLGGDGHRESVDAKAPCLIRINRRLRVSAARECALLLGPDRRDRTTLRNGVVSDECATAASAGDNLPTWSGLADAGGLHGVELHDEEVSWVRFHAVGIFWSLAGRSPHLSALPTRALPPRPARSARFVQRQLLRCGADRRRRRRRQGQRADRQRPPQRQRAVPWDPQAANSCRVRSRHRSLNRSARSRAMCPAPLADHRIPCSFRRAPVT